MDDDTGYPDGGGEYVDGLGDEQTGGDHSALACALEVFGVGVAVIRHLEQICVVAGHRRAER
ncbi:hypothetical protein AB0M43_37565 [Longispora sp. NPDC051575]|uniref:hypothetical protein n=1 Tax=Longispora sp. NPDC051575 TaxID=3154943 RepID=UPI00341304AB